MITSKHLQATLYVSVTQHTNLEQHLGVGEKKYSVYTSTAHGCMHPHPSRPQAPTCCPVRAAHTGATSNCREPRQSQTHGPHAPLTVLERGPLRPRRGKKQSTASPVGFRPCPPPGDTEAAALAPAAPGPRSTYPKMTAFHTMMLFSDGAPLTPAGGSSCNLRAQGTLMRRTHYPPSAFAPRPPLRTSRNPGR